MGALNISCMFKMGSIALHNVEQV